MLRLIPMNTLPTGLLHAIGFLVCFIVFKCTISDYFDLSFYSKSFKEKSTYATSFLNHEFAYLVDSKESIDYYTDKANATKHLEPYLGREYLCTSEMTYEQFCGFALKHDKFMFKPVDGCRGRGVEIMDSPADDAERVFNELKNETAILDELIVQHSDMDALCPKSVNTIRVFAYYNEKDVTILGCALRMGRGTGVVDNYCAGGLISSVNVETGKTFAPAEDMYCKKYSKHPYSNVDLVGFQVPNWDKVIALVNSAAKTFPLHYVGWDIAIRQNDCVVIEANPIGDLQTIQVAGATGKKALMKKLIKSV